MALECEADILPDRLGYRLTATDGYRTIDFIISEELATHALDFRGDGSILLERHLRDRLPEIWEACRTAYTDISGNLELDYLRLPLTTRNFRH
jgi:hypothetical protein